MPKIRKRRSGEKYVKLRKKLRKLEKLIIRADEDSSSDSSELSDILSVSSSSEDEPSQKIKSILGVDPNADTEFGPPLNDEIARRWQTYLDKGAVKEEIEAIMAGHKPPANLRNLVAPILNPEVSGSLTQAAAKTDGFLSKVQDQIAKSICIIAKPLNQIINRQGVPADVEQHSKDLADAAKLLADVQYSMSVHRRQLILPSLDPSLVSKLSDESPVGKYLFGTKLTQKPVGKSSIEMKGAQTTSTRTATSKSLSRNTEAETEEERVEEAVDESPSTRLQDTSSPTKKSFPGGRDVIKQAFLQKGTPEQGTSTETASLSHSTLKQYSSTYRKWWHFCTHNNADPYSPPENAILNFLVEQASINPSYNTLNSHRSALYFIIEITPNERLLIKELIKGRYGKNLVVPSINQTWDPNPVLDYLACLYPLENISLKQLSHKLVTLLALTSDLKVQTWAKTRTDDIITLKDKVEIHVSGKLKTSKKRNKERTIMPFNFFHDMPQLCTAKTLLFYVEKTKLLRGSTNNLFLTHRGNKHPAPPQTIYRWIKTTLIAAGVDVSKFEAPKISLTSDKSNSAAAKSAVYIETIKRAAVWTEKSHVFNEFYNKPFTSFKGDALVNPKLEID